ncbi:MAG: hypothetical protein ACRDJN_31540, partial [Chloroflexota bacterium]
MVRIYVVGGAGSGKTTLAKWAGAHLGCPVAHFDDLFFRHDARGGRAVSVAGHVAVAPRDAPTGADAGDGRAVSIAEREQIMRDWRDKPCWV